MQIRPSNQSIAIRKINPSNRQVGKTPVFAGTPPKMPEFMKPYHDRKDLKSVSTGKKAIIILGGTAAIVGLTAAAHIVLPVAIAGIAIFLGIFALTMGILKCLVPMTSKPPEGTKGMTKEQMMEASKYEEERVKYERNQKWKKIKKFFGAS